jgi:hypothetical protein
MRAASARLSLPGDALFSLELFYFAPGTTMIGADVSIRIKLLVTCSRAATFGMAGGALQRLNGATPQFCTAGWSSRPSANVILLKLM